MSAVPKKWALWSLLVAGGMLLQPQSACADVERYRPVPLGGGLVFILDTREGHAWTWQQSPQETFRPVENHPESYIRVMFARI